jgi:hypothetical protein
VGKAMRKKMANNKLQSLQLTTVYLQQTQKAGGFLEICKLSRCWLLMYDKAAVNGK